MTETGEKTILEALDSTIEEIRHTATRKLPEVFNKIPSDILLKALGDESWRVRKAAVEVASACSFDDELLAALAGGLSSQDNAGLRNSASEVLINAGEKAMATVAGLLENEDKDVRKFAADILGELKLPQALHPLAKALSDEDENVRGAAAEAMGSIGDPSCVPRLLASLGDDGLLVKLSALDSLNRLGAKVPFDVLESLLSVGPLRPMVLKLMGAIDDPQSMKRAAEILVDALNSRSKADLAAAVSSLIRLVSRLDKHSQIEMEVKVAQSASDALCIALERLLDSADQEQKAAAVTILGWTGRTEAVESLLRAASDESLNDRIFGALEAIGPKGATRLDELLDDLGRAEKVLALKMLGHYGNKSTLASIVQKCLDEDQEVAQAAQLALGEVGDLSVIQSLLKIIETGGHASRGAVGAMTMLGKKFHDELLEGLMTVMDSGSADARRFAAETICGIALKSDQALLQELTGDQDPLVRAYAIDALGKIGAEGVVDRIRMMLADESEHVRMASARALGRQKGRGAVDGLVLLLRDEHADVVREALGALGELGERNSAEHVVPLLAHDDVLVAISATRALGLLAWNGDSEVLEYLCTSADPEVLKELLASSTFWLKPKLCTLIGATLGNSRWDVRMAAVKVIAARGEKECFKLLAEHAEKETDELVREEINRVLDTMQDKESSW